MTIQLLDAPADPIMTIPGDVATTAIEFVGPTKAAEWLANNPDNRKPSAVRVAKYVRMMETGEWRAGHATIAIGKDGILCNGQHTLAAIFKSGLGFPCVIVRDPRMTGPRDWRGDDGRVRSMSFQTGIDIQVLAIAKLVLYLTAPNKAIAESATQDDIVAVAEKVNRHIGRLTTTAAYGCSSAPSKLAALTRMLLHPDKARAIAATYSAFVHGDREGMTQPMMSLRDSVLRGTVSARGHDKRMDMLVRCLAAFDPARADNTKQSHIRSFDYRMTEAKKLVAEAWRTA